MIGVLVIPASIRAAYGMHVECLNHSPIVRVQWFKHWQAAIRMTCLGVHNFARLILRCRVVTIAQVLMVWRAVSSGGPLRVVDGRIASVGGGTGKNDPLGYGTVGAANPKYLTHNARGTNSEITQTNPHRGTNSEIAQTQSTNSEITQNHQHTQNPTPTTPPKFTD